MKRSLLLLALIAVSLKSYGQGKQNVLRPAGIAATNKLLSVDHEGLTENLTKTLLCLDTIRYPQAKEQILGTNNFYTFDVWNSDVESFSQTFLFSGTGLSVKGAEIFCVRADPADPNVGANPTGISIRARLFNVNASNVPTGAALATGNVTISDLVGGANANYYTVNFTTPVAVTGNYAIVWDVFTTNGIVTFYVSDAAPGQSYDEDFARFKSSYTGYPSAGSYISIPTLTAGFTGGPFNFEPIFAPIVQYTITSTATVTPDPACVNQVLSYNGTAGPSNILSNRFYNYQKFQQYFMGAVTDSTYVWDFDDASAYVWGTQTTTHAYATAGSFDPAFVVLGGFWNSCTDLASDNTTINPLPTINAGADVAICSGAVTTLTGGTANTYSWTPATGLSSTTSASTNASPTSTTTYTLTGTSAAGCVNSDQVLVTVNSVTDAAFNYTTNTFCTGSANPVPTAANTGTYSSTAGLTFVNTTTGEINLAGSTNGSYVVTHTTTGLCPDVETQTITITAAPNANFSYANPAYCQNESNPFPSFGTGASAGVFSSTGGLNFVNANTGQINLAASAPGSYTITNTIAASGACPMASGTFGITINAQPAVNAGNDQSICAGTQVTLSGAGANTYTWDNGVVNGTSFTPAVGAVSYTVTGTTTSTGCTNTDQVVVTVNALPTVNAGTDQTVCEGTQVTLTGTGAATFSWTNGVTNGTPFTPSVGTVIYSVTGTSVAGCVNTDDVTVTVNANPVVNAGIDQTICIEDGAITLSSGSPAGGTYSGAGVTGAQFNPTTSGVGTFNVSYAVTTNGCTGSDDLAITVEQCMGVEELDINISIAPNPASETITISQDGTGDLSFTLLSEDGKTVIASTKLNAATHTVNVSQLATGIYFLQFSNKEGQMVKKIIIE